MPHAVIKDLCLRLTDLADADVTLRLAGCIGLVLAIVRRDLAWRWILAVGGALGIILVLKLAFGLVLALGAAIDVRSPSGHTCSSSLVYGGLALLLAADRRIGTGAAVVVAAVIGGTRLALGAHSVPEVVLGGAVGVLAVALLGRWLASRAPLSSRQRIVLAGCALVPVILFDGHVSSIEGRLDKLEYGTARSLGLPTWPGEKRYLKLYGG